MENSNCLHQNSPKPEHVAAGNWTVCIWAAQRSLWCCIHISKHAGASQFSLPVRNKVLHIIKSLAIRLCVQESQC